MCLLYPISIVGPLWPRLLKRSVEFVIGLDAEDDRLHDDG